MIPIMQSSRPKSKSRRSAFTLIEIMVATTVMVFLVALVILITSGVLKIWNSASGRLSANAEARIAMELLTQDLETAVFRNNGQQWLRVEGPIDLPGTSDFSEQTVSLKLFAPALDRPKKDASNTPIPGDICAIGYRLAYQQSYDKGPNIYALYRKIVDAKTTFDSLMGEGSQDALEDGEWADTSILAEDNYLASNIVEFKVFIHADDGNDFPLNDADNDGEIKKGSLVVFGDDPTLDTDNPENKFATNLIYAEIVLTVVSDEGIEIMQLLADGQVGTGFVDQPGKTAFEQVIEAHGENFIRRVYFPAQPL